MNRTLLAIGLLGLNLQGIWAEPALTIYNQNFAVVRDTVSLDLKAGLNDVTFADTTAHLETDSVILRDPNGKVKLQVLEQNYRNDPISPARLLSLYEGKTLDFIVRETNKPDQIVQGKIIRSGYVMHSESAMQRYGDRYRQTQSFRSYGVMGSNEPIVEVNGKVQFGLPGQPLFPSLGDDTILKPLLAWKLNASKASKFDAEITYITGGMSWEADYNIVVAENSELLDLVGWVTIDNQSGKTFPNALLKLMAGDVHKIQDYSRADLCMDAATPMSMPAAKQGVTEKAFDEYHLYTLPRATTLRDNETKQVEFIRATGVKSAKIYVYDGLKVDWNRYGGYANRANVGRNEEFGTDSDTKVAVLREFKNSSANNLGVPLPKGRMRFYKQSDAQMEFTGENLIDHTPADELIKVYTGDAFDLVGERRRTNFTVNNSNHWCDETFEIKLRNHKKEAVEIRVVEHLYRWVNWEIIKPSHPFTKVNAQEMQFRVTVKPNEEQTVTYTVHYSW